jgi:hypothetical protein
VCDPMAYELPAGRSAAVGHGPIDPLGHDLVSKNLSVHAGGASFLSEHSGEAVPRQVESAQQVSDSDCRHGPHSPLQDRPCVVLLSV